MGDFCGIFKLRRVAFELEKECIDNMFTVNDVIAEYMRLDAVFGVKIADIPVRVSSRFVRKLGMCRFAVDSKGRYVPIEITIGEYVLKAEADVFYDTIRHEYTHALAALRDGCNHGHDGTWKKACIEVGCNPRATIKAAEAGNVQAIKDEAVKYIVRCTECGNESKYYRKGRVVTSILDGKKMYRCRCGGSLEVVIK